MQNVFFFFLFSCLHSFSSSLNFDLHLQGKTMLTRMLSMGGSTPGKYKHGDSIVVFDKAFNHTPEKEMDFIVSCDKIPPQCGDECYLISARWIKRWMEYGKGKGTLKSVGPIDNQDLVDEENKTRADIEQKIDYRCISKVMWYVIRQSCQRLYHIYNHSYTLTWHSHTFFTIVNIVDLFLWTLIALSTVRASSCAGNTCFVDMLEVRL